MLVTKVILPKQSHEFIDMVIPTGKNILILWLLQSLKYLGLGNIYYLIISIVTSLTEWVFTNGLGDGGLNPRLSHTKDSKNGTWYRLAKYSEL